MKKLVLLVVLAISCCTQIHAQNPMANIEETSYNSLQCREENQRDTVVLYIENLPLDHDFCLENAPVVLVYAQPNCDEFLWTISGQETWDNPVVICPPQQDLQFIVSYDSGENCGNLHHTFRIKYKSNTLPNSFTHDKWKLLGETETLEAVGIDSTGSYYGYGFLWNTGETTGTIDVTDPGTYTCEISHACGTVTRTFIVRDKVEIYRATIDLETNLNKVTWPIISGQDEYIGEVKVYRDGLLVGTVPYEQGYFLDNIGSDNAARNYHLVAVTTDGEESPVSYQKGTIHTTYYQDVNNNLNMTWNIPYVEEGAQGTLTYFQICKYDPNTGDLTVVDQVNSLITDYTCGLNQFEGGYPVIAAVFSDAKDRDYEDRSFSNIGTNILVQPQEISISLLPGWTWISYTEAEVLDIPTALGDFMPMNGDMIKSQHGNAAYIDGQWRGSLMYFNPGWGYKYYSTRSEPATLIFGGSRRIRK